MYVEVSVIVEISFALKEYNVINEICINRFNSKWFPEIRTPRIFKFLKY